MYSFMREEEHKPRTSKKLPWELIYNAVVKSAI